MAFHEFSSCLREQLTQIPADLDGKKSAATALILTADTGEFLLIQRATHPKDPWSGQMALPGGRRDPHDLDLLATAIREVFEEVGLSLLRDECVGYLSPLTALPHRPADPLVIQPIVFVVQKRSTLQLNHEVAETLWVPLKKLQGNSHRSTVTLERQGQRLQFPSWNFSQKQVWGLTERMLQSFLKRYETALRTSE